MKTKETRGKVGLFLVSVILIVFALYELLFNITLIYKGTKTIQEVYVEEKTVARETR